MVNVVPLLDCLTMKLSLGPNVIMGLKALGSTNGRTLRYPSVAVASSSASAEVTPTKSTGRGGILMKLV